MPFRNQYRIAEQADAILIAMLLWENCAIFILFSDFTESAYPIYCGVTGGYCDLVCI